MRAVSFLLLSSLVVAAGCDPASPRGGTSAASDDRGGDEDTGGGGDTTTSATTSNEGGASDSVGDTGGSRGDDGSTGNDGGSHDDGGDTSDGGTMQPCDADPRDLVPEGWAEASSVFETLFSSYPPELSIDGDPATSWFSAGADGDGLESEFTWTIVGNHCIDEITIYGNGAHANPDFREGYGFESVTVQVLDTADEVVFEDWFALEGTPDPIVEVDVGGAVGQRVRLLLEGHESPECGGFADLEVIGRDL